MDLKSQLREFEGWVPHAYQDSRSFWTIGCGRLIDKRKGGGLSDLEIDYLLENDIRSHTVEVMKALPWAAHLTMPRQAVLIGMSFQMGLKGLLGFRSMLSSCRDEKYEDAAEHMRQSLWAKQTPKRAKRMAAQMATGEWN